MGRKVIRICACSADRTDDPTTGGSLRQGLANIATAACGAAAAIPANHVLRFLRRLFGWGIRHGHCTINPAEGVRQAKEVGQFSMPTPEAFRAVLKFARQRARLKLHSKGAVPPTCPR